MWLGPAAGLALLTLFFASVHARNVSVTDRQLSYQGNWGVFIAPACSTLSQTVHSTNNADDSVAYNFTGNGVYVFGPHASSVIIVLDNAEQVASPTVDGDGCSVLFQNTDLQNGQHSLYMVYTAAQPSSGFSISAITVTVPDVLPPAIPLTAAPAPSTSPTSLSPLNAGPTLSPAPTTTSAEPATTMAAEEPSPSETTDAVATTGFVTTSGMIRNLIGAIVGILLGMIALLLLFIFIRRRITRGAARKMDLDSNFGRNLEEGKTKGGFVGEGYGSPMSAGEKQQQFEAAPPGPQYGTNPSPIVAVSHPSHGSGSIAITSPSRSASTTYTVDLGFALLNRPPSGAEHQDPRTLSRLRIPTPVISASTPRSRPQSSSSPMPPASTPAASYLAPTSAFNSPRGSDASPRVPVPGHIVNRSGSIESNTWTKPPEGPPGYI